MAKLQTPQNAIVVGPRGDFSRVWFTFFNVIAQRFTAFEQVTAATSTVSAAPVAYTQAQNAELVAAVAELKSKVNALIAASQK